MPDFASSRFCPTLSLHSLHRIQLDCGRLSIVTLPPIFRQKLMGLAFRYFMRYASRAHTHDSSLRTADFRPWVPPRLKLTAHPFLEVYTLAYSSPFGPIFTTDPVPVLPLTTPVCLQPTFDPGCHPACSSLHTHFQKFTLSHILRHLGPYSLRTLSQCSHWQRLSACSRLSTLGASPTAAHCTPISRRFHSCIEFVIRAHIPYRLRPSAPLIFWMHPSKMFCPMDKSKTSASTQ